jgi:acetyl-CoA carboxylase carboxyltransferase component
VRVAFHLVDVFAEAPFTGNQLCIVPEAPDGLSDAAMQTIAREIGTFSRSIRLEDRERTPGDGKIGGHGTIDGRPVAVFGDDITVLRGSSSIVGTRKEHRLYERALAINPDHAGTNVVELEDGRVVELDALVCATGFNAAGPPPFRVTGKNGANLSERYKPYPET